MEALEAGKSASGDSMDYQREIKKLVNMKLTSVWTQTLKQYRLDYVMSPEIMEDKDPLQSTVIAAEDRQ